MYSEPESELGARKNPELVPTRNPESEVPGSTTNYKLHDQDGTRSRKLNSEAEGSIDNFFNSFTIFSHIFGHWFLTVLIYVLLLHSFWFLRNVRGM